MVSKEDWAIHTKKSNRLAIGWRRVAVAYGTNVAPVISTNPSRAAFAKALLTVPAEAADPIITGQPENITSAKGGGIAFSISALTPDSGTLSYQWYSNEVNSNTGGSEISGATKNPYNLSASDAVGTHCCYAIVTNTGLP